MIWDAVSATWNFSFIFVTSGVENDAEQYCSKIFKNLKVSAKKHLMWTFQQYKATLYTENFLKNFVAKNFQTLCQSKNGFLVFQS